MKYNFVCFLLLIFLPVNSDSLAEDIPFWWDNYISVDQLKMSEDKFEPSSLSVRRLLSNGIPINVVFLPTIKGKDIIYKKISSEESGEENYKWELVKSKNPRIDLQKKNVKIKDVVKHYCDQYKEYKLIFTHSIPVIIFKDACVDVEKIKCDGMKRTNVTIFDVADHYNRQLLEKSNSAFNIQAGNLETSYPQDTVFNIDFSGGTLMEMLCDIVYHLNQSDSQHSHCWTIAGPEHGIKSIGINALPKFKLLDKLLN